MASTTEGTEPISDMEVNTGPTGEVVYVTRADHDASIDVVRAEAVIATAAIKATMSEWKDMMDKKIDELETQMEKSQEQARPKQDRAREGITSRRAFSQLASYTGKIEEYDDWAFQMRRFLS